MVQSDKSDTLNSTPTSWLDRPLLALVNLDWEKALYGLFIVLAIVSRLWELGLRVMSHDETVHVQWSWYLFQGRGYAHTPLSHGPFLFHATALSYYLFGDNDFSARLVVAILGIVLVALPYTLRRWLGRSGALAASFLFLISPSLLYYSRYIRHDIPIIVWSLIALLAIFRYLDQQPTQPTNEPTNEPTNQQTNKPTNQPNATRWLVILAAAISLMFATKEVAFIYIAIFGLFLALLFFARLGAPLWRTPEWEQAGRVMLWIAAGALLIAVLTFGLSGVIEKTETETAGEAAPALVLEPESTDAEATFSAADLLHQVATGAAAGTALALLGYVVLLALASPSHQRLVLTIAGLIGIVVVAMGLLLFSLGLVELFPIRYRDCGQAPLPGPAPGQMQCTESDCKLIQGRCQRPIPVVTTAGAVEFDQGGARIAIQLTHLEMLIAIVLIGIITMATGVNVYLLLERLMPFRQGEKPALDLILFIGSFTLPFLAAAAINGVPKVVTQLLFGHDTAFNSLDYSDAGLVRSLGFVLILVAVSVAVGLWWDWRRWLAAAGVFFVIFVVLFTTIFTNGNGLASGAVGSLGYWIEQQAVQRGSQPIYYYGIVVPLYEYLPLIGFFAAVLYALLRGLKAKNSTTSPLAPTFVLFLFFWTPLTWLAYSYAGEKMPWLTTHFAVPMALATGWIVGKLVESVNWRAVLRRGGWIIVLLAPVGLAALVQTVSPWLAGPGTPRPFSGHGLGQLNATMQFTSALIILAISAGVLYRVQQRIGLAAAGRTLAALAVGVLMLLTIRTAWLFNYVNYDYATEFLVYAHSTPDMREIMKQIEDISRRSAGDLSLDIGYTGDGSYPLIWYLRNYSNAVQLPNPPSRPDLDKSVIVAGDDEWSGIEPYMGENFVCNKYYFMWWPMQDYFGLTWERIRYALTNPQMRGAIWDIAFRRDYRKYEQATGKTLRSSQWSPSDGIRLCVRRDVAARVWSESAGPGEFGAGLGAAGPGDVTERQSDYRDLEQLAITDLEIKDLGAFGNLSSPHDLALDAAGFLYVTDTDNHRIVKFSPEGEVVDTWDSTWWRGLQSWQPGCVDAAGQALALGDGEFCEPWGITVGPDGNVYVADTWNHRIQVFTPDGQFLNKVGVFGQSGSSVSSAPAQFYGPRDVAVDRNGYVYVTDTGNKRIQVFDSNLNHLRSFGGPGLIEGRLDEPVGLVIGPDDLLYVADTWNKRIQVFTLQGDYVWEWPVAAWDSQSIVNKPYLATDSAGRIYVSDPEGSRVIVFDGEGAPLAMIGQSASFLQLPTGVVLDAQDRLWVSDAATHRLLRFPPLNFVNDQQEDPS